MAELNCAFIEVLPEVTLRIGIMLENEKLTRDAFSILVSEEALNLGTVNLLVPGPTNARLSPPYPHALKNHTRLHRPIQDVIDEDWRNTIQHASRSLAARVKKTFDDLLEPSLVWLQNLPPEPSSRPPAQSGKYWNSSSERQSKVSQIVAESTSPRLSIFRQTSLSLSPTSLRS